MEEDIKDIKKEVAELKNMISKLLEKNYTYRKKNELPPHTFPLLNLQEYQCIYKEAQQEVPKEEN